MPKGYRVDGLKIARELSARGAATQAARAQRLDIHWVTMSNIENGKARVSLELLERIAKETRRRREDFMLPDEDEAPMEAAPVGRQLDMLEALWQQLGGVLGKNEATA